MQRCAIFAYVSNTQLPEYDNRATIGVGAVAGSIMTEIKPKFKNDLFDLGPNSTVQSITANLSLAAEKLEDRGFCLFYFHGHGDSITGKYRNDEKKDQVLVCHDGFLFDDAIDQILSTFKPTQRILTIVDSCSSETVVEWSKHPMSAYPQMIHIASSTDDGVALANRWGGIFSRKILNLVYNMAYYNYTYDTFIRRLQWQSTYSPCLVRISDNVKTGFLRTKLFD